MSFWQQYAQLTRFSERAIDINQPFNQVCLDNGEPVDLDDRATKAFFELVEFDPKVPFWSYGELYQSLRFWLKDIAGNPMAMAVKVNNFFNTRHVGDSWTKLDSMLGYMSGPTLSATVDATDVILIPGDNIQAGADYFSVNIGVVGDDLLSNFSTIHCRAVASSFDRLLPTVQAVVDDQANRYLRLRDLHRESSEYLSVHKDLRCKPLWVSVNKNGSFFMESGLDGHPQNDFTINWGQVKFRSADMASVASVVAIASRSQGNKLKGRYLEEALGL
jgi:hypothetical protein